MTLRNLDLINFFFLLLKIVMQVTFFTNGQDMFEFPSLINKSF